MITLEKLKEEIEAIEARTSISPSIENFTFAINNVKKYMQDVTLLELLKNALDNATLPDFETGKIPCYEEEIKDFIECHLNKLPALISFIKYDGEGQELANLKAENEAIKILMGENHSSRKFKIKEKRKWI